MKKDVTTLLFWLGISLYFVIESWRLGLGHFNMPGTGFLPFWVALLLGILTISELVRELSKKRSEEVEKLVRKEGLRRMLYVLVFICAYPFFLDKIGFFLCTLIFSGACLKIIGGKRWLAVTVMSILITFFAYTVFVIWLGMLFPEGRWINGLVSIGRNMLWN